MISNTICKGKLPYIAISEQTFIQKIWKVANVIILRIYSWLHIILLRRVTHTTYCSEILKM